MSRPQEPGPDKSGHGYRNEVNWNGGQGSQPYSNQGDEEGAAPNTPPEHAEGDRGSQSGANLDQLEQVKRKP